MITVIEKLDGTRYNLLEYGFLTLDLVVSPIDLVFDSENVPGRPGRIRTRSDYGNRKVSLKLLTFAKDQADMIAKRDTLASLLDSNEPIYIYESVGDGMYGFEYPGEKTGEFSYQNIEATVDYSKRLLIQRVGNESMKFKGLVGKRTIEFETYDSPFWNDDPNLL